MPYGVIGSTQDFESCSLGSNPNEAVILANRSEVRTTDSESVDQGSNPCLPAKLEGRVHILNEMQKPITKDQIKQLLQFCRKPTNSLYWLGQIWNLIFYIREQNGYYREKHSNNSE